MGWKLHNEAIEMVEERFRYLPQLFRWRGRFFEVDAVERCWTVTRGRGRSRIERRYFQVQCGDGAYELYQDLVTGTWHLRRARLVRVRSAAIGRLVPAWR